MRLLLSQILLGVLLLSSCKKDQDIGSNEPQIEEEEAGTLLYLPTEVFDYAGNDFPESFYQTAGLSFFQSINHKEINNEQATLGRVLFYNKLMSENNTLSCASCHPQSQSFSGATFNITGSDGEIMTRTAPALINKEFNIRLFWDLRANSVEHQVSFPVKDPLELNTTFDEIANRLSETDYYPELFYQAFEDSTIDSTKIVNAIGQFVRSIRVYDTKFHRGLENDFASFTEAELRGKDLFFNNGTHCNQCHMTSNFYTPGSENNGLDGSSQNGDAGVVNGSFKVPSLVNVALTPPYMHDGRFNTLDEVIDFYNEGIQAHPGLSDQLTVEGQNGGTPIKMNLTAQEKTDLITFLHTLTDSTILSAPQFSNPFMP